MSLRPVEDPNNPKKDVPRPAAERRRYSTSVTIPIPPDF